MGVANLLHAAPIMKNPAGPGHPPYVATILGGSKVPAAAALSAPGLPRVKEWAYAGMFFTPTGAALSRAPNHDTALATLPPLVVLGVAMTSRDLGPRAASV